MLESDPDVLETVFGADSVTLGVDGAGNRTIAVAHSSQDAATVCVRSRRYRRSEAAPTLLSKKVKLLTWTMSCT